MNETSFGRRRKENVRKRICFARSGNSVSPNRVCLVFVVGLIRPNFFSFRAQRYRQITAARHADDFRIITANRSNVVYVSAQRGRVSRFSEAFDVRRRVVSTHRSVRQVVTVKGKRRLCVAAIPRRTSGTRRSPDEVAAEDAASFVVALGR